MKLFYNLYGTGEPLILIPGFASGAWNWFRQIEDLSKEFQLITYDPRGIGGSRLQNEDDFTNLSMEIFVTDLIQILNELKFEKAHVLGASFGGFVAQEAAIQFPDRIDKLILSCTSAGGANHIKPALEILHSFTPDPKLTVGERIRKFIRPAFTDEFNAVHADQVEEVCRLRESNEVNDQIYFAQLYAAFTFDAENHLGEIKNETMVITGDKDIVVPFKNSINLARKIPNATLKIIDGGSHLFFVEKAAEFNKAVIDFVKK